MTAAITDLICNIQSYVCAMQLLELLSALPAAEAALHLHESSAQTIRTHGRDQKSQCETVLVA